MQIERIRSNDLTVNALPDGSKVIVDSRQEKVFALNSTAGAAWDACNDQTTLSKVTEEMQRTFNPEINEEIAEQAILRLQEQNLVITADAASTTSRRQVLATLGAIALPLVVSLTMTDQRAYADDSRSGGGSGETGNNGDNGNNGDQGDVNHDGMERPDAHLSKPTDARR